MMSAAIADGSFTWRLPHQGSAAPVLILENEAQQLLAKLFKIFLGLGSSSRRRHLTSLCGNWSAASQVGFAWRKVLSLVILILQPLDFRSKSVFRQLGEREPRRIASKVDGGVASLVENLGRQVQGGPDFWLLFARFKGHIGSFGNQRTLHETSDVGH